MGIYIKGMEMPTSCANCDLAKHFDGYNENDCPFNCFSYYDCPLIPVPPHGRLIDADVVIDLVMQYCPDDDGVCSKAGADLRELLDEIENLPTVIPASKEET